MGHSQNEILLKNLHPYLFVLQEGKKIQENFLDYSLLLLQTTNAEIIPSPNYKEFITIPMPNRHGII